MRWWERLWVVMLVGLALAGTGCGHTVSETIRQQADTTISFPQLRQNPEAYKNHMVILGGEILRTQNIPDGTLLEVLQKPLDQYERPLLADHTQGRYMALCRQYLDAAIYRKGREITVAGRVLGTRKGQIGEIEYTYPVISCIELHLWAQPAPTPYRYDPYPWWYWDPWYWDPWYWRPHPHPFWRPYPFHW